MNSIKRKNPNTKSRQVGRGGKRGKTSGRGTKGQNSRAGRKKRPEMRDVIKKIPKLRGYKFSGRKDKPVIVKISIIEKNLKSDEKITPQKLIELGLAKKVSGRVPRIKILSDKKLETKIFIKGCLVSESVKKQVLELGGSVE